jgi:hypothetical protein
MLENCNCKLYYERSITTNRSVHINRQDAVILDKTIKAAYLIGVAMPNSHYLHGTITKKPQKYTDLGELTRVWQLNMAYIIPLMLSTVHIIPSKLHKSLKLLYFHPAVYIPMQKE